MLILPKILIFKLAINYFFSNKKNKEYSLQDIYNKVKKESLLKEVKHKFNKICE